MKINAKEEDPNCNLTAQKLLFSKLKEDERAYSMKKSKIFFLNHSPLTTSRKEMKLLGFLDYSVQNFQSNK